ncbi:hypothetical protein [Streptomyces sp. NPDC002573]|uniref:hypothetical protein n=1 Tax=Streptomyces sp. NPDC002573 TaxID=3364651 RepID=UPI0036B2DA2C
MELNAFNSLAPSDLREPVMSALNCADDLSAPAMLATSPAHLQRYWLFAAERRYGHARAWLADQGYRPSPPGDQ